MGTAAEIVRDYITALTSRDFDRARSLMTEDFSFRGPMAEMDGIEVFMAEAAGAYEFARGFRMLRQLEDGDEVSSIYELDVETPAARATMLMSEWNVVRDGRIASSLLVFDTSVHDTLMPEHAH